MRICSLLLLSVIVLPSRVRFYQALFFVEGRDILRTFCPLVFSAFNNKMVENPKKIKTMWRITSNGDAGALNGSFRVFLLG